LHRTSIVEALALAVRRLRQDQIGSELKLTQSADEFDWLDANLG